MADESSIREMAVEDCAERLAKARLMIGAATTRAAAKELLEGVIRDGSGTRYAREAMDLLQRYDGDEPPWQEPTPELAEWRERWRVIHGVEDGRLMGFLGDSLAWAAETRASATDPQLLFEEVDRDLRRWLGEGIRDLERARSSLDEVVLDPRRLTALIDLTGQLTDTRFEDSLAAELRRFADERYGLRLAQMSRAIRRATEDWALDEAWRKMRELDGPPAAFQVAWQALQEAIYAAEARRSEIEDVLGELPSELPRPNDWLELRRLLEIVEEMRERDLGDVPQAWCDRLRESSERVVAGALRFLEIEARGSHGLDKLSEFWKQVRHLSPGRLDSRLELRASWFDEPLESLATELAVQVRDCEAPADLEVWMRRFIDDLEVLPPQVRGACRPWIDQLEVLVANWRSLERGERFAVPVVEDLAVPEMVPVTFSDKVDRYGGLLEQIDASLTELERPGASPEVALELARRALEQVPGHVGAQRLQRRAQALELRLEIDVALAGWDIEGFLRLVEEPGLSPPYHELRQQARALRQLARQASMPGLGSTHEAAAWWRAWQAARRQLPTELPTVLEAGLVEQEKVRCREWREALQELLASDPEVSECRTAATELAEADVPGLGRYRRELERRERVGRVERLLEEERWDLAQEQLADLPRDDREVRRLGTALALGRARQGAVGDLAEELHRRWNDAVTFHGTEAFEWLCQGFEDAWRHGDARVLRQLEGVARRAVRDERADAGKRDVVGDWLEWLSIEHRLASGVTAAGLRRLVTYLESPLARDIASRCRALIERWRAEEETVALAWAWRALSELEPPLFPEVTDPAEILEQASQKTAGEVLERLQESTDLEGEQLREMSHELRHASGIWHDLSDYLDLLPRAIDRPRPPAELSEVESRLADFTRTLSTIEELEQTDLRSRGMDTRWSGARRFLVEELERSRRRGEGDVPLASALLKRLRPLEPLTGLNFAESQLHRAARRCASAEPEDLDAEGLFAELAACVVRVVDEFERAGRVGSAMWRIVSEEYWTEIPAVAGDLNAPPADGADLHALTKRFLELEDDERQWRDAVRKLDQSEPIVSGNGTFAPASHGAYLESYPEEPPRSRRVFRLFDRFASGADQRTILTQSVSQLPEWIGRYLQEGVP